MGRRLQNPSSSGKAFPIVRQNPFRIAFEEPLENGFELKDADNEAIKRFHRFLVETVYKNLTISEVDKLYLRKRGMNQSEKHNGRDVFHYGKDRNPFRIFGTYNLDGYFVVFKIDGKHKTHKE